MFFIKKKKDTYNLIVINKNLILSKNRRLNKKIEPLLVATQQHQKKITFDIIIIVTGNIILEMPKLRKYKLIIN